MDPCLSFLSSREPPNWGRCSFHHDHSTSSPFAFKLHLPLFDELYMDYLSPFHFLSKVLARASRCWDGPACLHLIAGPHPPGSSYTPFPAGPGGAGGGGDCRTGSASQPRPWSLESETLGLSPDPTMCSSVTLSLSLVPTYSSVNGRVIKALHLPVCCKN